MPAHPAASPAPQFHDRAEAGQLLAVRLERLRPEAPVVLALPRGGVPVAVEVARALNAPLDVLVVHKAGEPGARVGAVAEGGLAVLDHPRAQDLGLDAEQLTELRERAGATVDTAARRLRGAAPPLDIVGRTVLLVDDGVGTGLSAVAAARTARRRGAGRIVLAVPIAGAAALTRLGEELDEIVCLEVAPLARWYEHAPAVTDADVTAALAAPRREDVPEAARGAVVLGGQCDVVHRTLDQMGFATVALAPEEDPDDAIARLRTSPATERLAIGLFGFGAAAATVLAAAAEGSIAAVVAAGGRPDRAPLAQIAAPALLVIGGEDRHVVRLTRLECRGLTVEHSLALVPGAGHDFAEPGAMEQVAHLAGTWFARHL